MRQFGVAADALADVEAVRIRQHDVEQDQVRTLPAAQFDRAFPRLRADEGEALFFQVVLQESVQIRVVFDQSYFPHVANLKVTRDRYNWITIRLIAVDAFSLATAGVNALSCPDLRANPTDRPEPAFTTDRP